VYKASEGHFANTDERAVGRQCKLWSACGARPAPWDETIPVFFADECGDGYQDQDSNVDSVRASGILDQSVLSCGCNRRIKS
jgi:hypothetical protein